MKNGEGKRYVQVDVSVCGSLQKAIERQSKSKMCLRVILAAHTKQLI